MRNRTETPGNVPTGKLPSKETRKPVSNWMQLEIAPLVAKRMQSRKPFPGAGR